MSKQRLSKTASNSIYNRAVGTMLEVKWSLKVWSLEERFSVSKWIRLSMKSLVNIGANTFL